MQERRKIYSDFDYEHKFVPEKTNFVKLNADENLTSIPQLVQRWIKRGFTKLTDQNLLELEMSFTFPSAKLVSDGNLVIEANEAMEDILSCLENF